MGEIKDSTTATIRHGGARIEARCAAELRQGHGYGKLGQGEGFALDQPHGEVRGFKAKLDDLSSTREVAGVGQEDLGTVAA